LRIKDNKNPDSSSSFFLTNKEYTMSKNTSANRPAKEVRQEVKSKPEITELSFEAMETLSGGCKVWLAEASSF
jgi:hypothetical protein